jgi:hypothetical protein
MAAALSVGKNSHRGDELGGFANWIDQSCDTPIIDQLFPVTLVLPANQLSTISTPRTATSSQRQSF